MVDIRLTAQQESVARVADGAYVSQRALRDGAAIYAPWVQALVFEGKCFGIHVGSVTTPIAGHVAVDADQPEASVNIPDGTEAMPLFLTATCETGSTTLGVGGLMFAVSNILTGAGTSTTATPFNLRIDAPIATAASAYVAFTGNGTDPLTAGNFLELGRQSFILDSDAATSGIIGARIALSALERPMPVIVDGGSLLFYAEHATTAPSVFATMLWAEFTEGTLT